MPYFNGLRLSLFIVSAGITASAATWHVDPAGSDSADGTNWPTALQTISNALNRAGSSAADVVLVADGAYLITEELSVPTSIVVRSVNGPEVTSISRNPSSTNRLFNLQGGAFVSGFTLSDGLLYASNSLSYANGLWGGGVYMTSATLSNCVITGCRILQTHSNLLGGGGGIYMNHDKALVVDCLISNNMMVAVTTNNTGNGSNKMGGGGIFLDRGTVTNCTIATNTYAHTGTMSGHSGGGGVNLYGTSTRGYLIDCRIVDNVCNGLRGWEGGGGVRLGFGIVRNCLISRNYSYRRGGGIMLVAGEGSGSSMATVQVCRITGNRCPGGTNTGGNGIHLSQGTAVIIENCLFADGIGPMELSVEAGTGSWTIRNCTIASYEGTNSIYRYSGTTGPVSFVNCAISGPITNRTVTTNWWVFSHCLGPVSPLFPAGAYGNIAGNPLFRNAVTGDYRPGLSSPCIDAGTNQTWMTNAWDLDGNARLVSGRVDIGAYESPYRKPTGALVQIR